MRTPNARYGLNVVSDVFNSMLAIGCPVDGCDTRKAASRLPMPQQGHAPLQKRGRMRLKLLVLGVVSAISAGRWRNTRAMNARISAVS